MRAIAVTALGGPEVLHVVDLPDPAAGPGQVLVRVRAACVQPADAAARVGRLPGGPVPPPFLPGWDFAGDVVAVGATDSRFHVGDRVVGLVPWHLTRGTPGSYAQLVAADVDWLTELPTALDYATASTLPLNGQTASQAVRMLAGDGPLLVVGASGGVGGFAVQLARQAGRRVLAVANDHDQDWVREIGADEVVTRSAGPAALGQAPAVFDAVPVGAAAANATKDGGVLVTTRPTEPVDPARGVRRQVVLIRPDQRVLRDLVTAAAVGRLRTRVAATIPFERAAEAHRIMATGGLPGKVVLTF
ncbi:NADPH:quinone reductase-like Zn-dependent oxidoreductase [Hamadaea flava]|uniref:NADP-dependent oxidoreductase n=1 Tax=Hamadaea flava TaxID=1742688 RepID=A0ABV8LR36_9ACTN|nr:NADP-dependent oxidoreductase [Hamadaea flava]MCP2322599.1 NADPH:quinone reductase-like Zn-dependent oxidoreductase [Hamadaea flava]